MAAKRVESGRGRRSRVVSEQRRSNRPFAIALGVVAILGVLALAWTVMRPKRGVTEVDLKADPAQARGYLLGDSTAPVQVMEYADFECPACGTFATLTEPDIRKSLIQTGKVSWRYYDFPLPMHKNTWDASNAAACADEQGKFWEMHDMLLDHQDALTPPDLGRYAGELALDVDRFWDELRRRVHAPRVAEDVASAELSGVSGTPSFFINGRRHWGAYDLATLTAAVRAAAARARLHGADRQPEAVA